MRGFELKHYDCNDTIAALATFPGKSGLAVIKMSGKKAIAIAARIFVPAQKKDLRKAKTFTLHYGWIAEKAKTKKVLDEVLVSLMRGPRSYTAEDVVEISTHGGVFVAQRILELLMKCGARLAMPGEFTYRALVHGRLDVFQAESVADIVDARSEEGLRLAVAQLKGDNRCRIESAREEVKELLALTEAALNFPDDEAEASQEEIKNRLQKIVKKIEALIVSSQQARVVNEGLRCVICGRTNTGKSTLFNLLLNEERVIVSPQSGTTRDVVEETISLRGVPLRIYDTAGILDARDLISRKAVEKSAQAFAGADLIILVLDGSRKLSRHDWGLLEKIAGRPAIIVVNKSDLPQKIQINALKKYSGSLVRFSALKNHGLRELEAAAVKKFHHCGVSRKDMVFLSRWQQDILARSIQSLREAGQFMDKGYTLDYVNLAIKGCLEDFARLSGEVLTEEILENIFSRFCIGK